MIGGQNVSMHDMEEYDSWYSYTVEFRLGGQTRTGGRYMKMMLVSQSEPRNWIYRYPRVRPGASRHTSVLWLGLLTVSGGVDYRLSALGRRGLDRAKDWLDACLKDHDCRASATGQPPCPGLSACPASPGRGFFRISVLLLRHSFLEKTSFPPCADLVRGKKKKTNCLPTVRLNRAATSSSSTARKCSTDRYFVYFTSFTKLSRWNKFFPGFYPVFGYIVCGECIAELEDALHS